MSKAIIVGLIATFVVLSEGGPVTAQEFVRAAANGDWGVLRRVINEGGFDDLRQTNFAGSVANLKPSDGTHVFGQAETSFQSVTNDNGKIVKNSGGYGIINSDGTTKDYYFTPRNIYGN